MHIPTVQTVQRQVEVPQVEYVDQVFLVQTVQKIAETSQVECADQHAHIPFQKHCHVLVHILTQKAIEVTVVETMEKIVDALVVKQIGVPQVQTIVVEVPLCAADPKGCRGAAGANNSRDLGARFCVTHFSSAGLRHSALLTLQSESCLDLLWALRKLKI